MVRSWWWMPVLFVFVLAGIGVGPPARADSNDNNDANSPDGSLLLQEESSMTFFKKVNQTDPGREEDDPPTPDNRIPGDDRVVVPEPATLGLLAVGVVALGIVRRRRR